MLKKRLIFNLLVSNGIFQLSRNFSLQNVGSLDWLYTCYNLEAITSSIDELIITNVSRNPNADFDSFSKVVKKLATKVFVPLTIGGGIRSYDDAVRMMELGADRLLINTLLFKNPNVVSSIAKVFGEQCIVGGIDFLHSDRGPIFLIENGTIPLKLTAPEVANLVMNVGVGELMITCITKDGTGTGLDIRTTEQIGENISIPIIAAGGVGKFDHLTAGLNSRNISAVSTANIFNFMSNGLIDARNFIKASGIPLAEWTAKI